MLHTFLLPFLFILLQNSDSYKIDLNPKTSDFCQFSQKWEHVTDLFSENQEAFTTNDVLSCNATELFLLSDGVIETDVHVDLPGENDFVSVIVYRKIESHDIIIAKEDIYLSKAPNDDFTINISIRSETCPGYILLLSRQSNRSKTFIKSLQFKPANITKYIEYRAIEAKLETENYKGSDNQYIINPVQSINPMLMANTDVPSPMVTIPFSTTNDIILPDIINTPIVSVPFPAVGEIVAPNPTFAPIITVPFPIIGETTNADTTIVTVPFPTIGLIPTTPRSTIVTIPFPTVSDLVTAEDTTINPSTIITIPFPTIGEISPASPTTEDPTDVSSTIVTIPFPTVSEIGTLDPITYSTTDSLEETTISPDISEEATGLSVLAIVLTTIGSVAFVVLAGFIIWYLVRGRRSVAVTAKV